MAGEKGPRELKPAPSRVRDLARRLLAHEVAARARETAAPPGRRRGTGTKSQVRQATAEAAEHVWQKLRGHLARLIGPAGFDTLLGRALLLAQRECPSLQRVRLEAEGRLTGLRESVRAAEETRTDLAIVLANFLWLLVTLIGGDLALHLVAEIWPDVSLRETGSRSEEMTP